MITTKLNQYFFLIAAVIAILDGAFKLHPEMESIKIIVLIIAGLAVGVLTQAKKQQFLIAGISVVITGILFTQLLGPNLALFTGILQMILNFTIFLSAALLVVGLHFVSDIITGEPEPEETKETKAISKGHEKETFHEHFERIWGYVILVAVALTFIILLAEVFFDTNNYSAAITVIEMAITALFITDLVILYQHAKGPLDFVKTYIFDIIAAIPVVGVLQVFKIIRVVRFVRILRSGSKIAKVSKSNKTVKYLSDKSSFNKVNKKNDDKKKKTKN